MRKFVIVGSGNRVRNNFLPAIAAMEGEAKTIALASRNKRNAQQAGEPWCVPSANSVSELPWEDADAVVVSIPPGALISTLADIRRIKPAIDVVVDTPALPATSAWRYRIFDGFSHVAVAEDYMNFPPFELMRRVCAQLGRPTRIRLEGAGYSYHGIALIRSFYDFAAIEHLAINEHAGERKISFRMRGGGAGEMTYPYDRSTGRVVVEVAGKELIFDFSGKNVSTRKNQIFVRHGSHRTIAEAGSFELADMRLQHDLTGTLLMLQPQFDRSAFNLMKTCGLTDVLRSKTIASVNAGYGARNGAYDSIIGRITQINAHGFEGLLSRLANGLLSLPSTQTEATHTWKTASPS